MGEIDQERFNALVGEAGRQINGGRSLAYASFLIRDCKYFARHLGGVL